MRRFFTIDKFNTWYDWRLTLTAKDVTPPKPKTNYVSLDGMHGTLDLSEALTGEVVYDDRTVKASFWTSEGTFQERWEIIKQMVSTIHGKKVPLIEPDDPDHYFLGRVKLTDIVHDQVHAELKLEATCEPWRYALHETERLVEVDGDTDVVINNHGVKTLCPDITVTGTVSLTFDGITVRLTDGVYKIADLRLVQGANVVRLAGYGTVTFTYREAVL